MKKKITIHDVSKALGVDSSTVSRALNDSPRVKQKTKDLIVNKAKELGYQRNRLASKLRTNKSHTIGVIVPRISRHYFSSAIAGIEEASFDGGFEVIICQSLESLEREKKLVNTLLSNRVDGILISISMETTEFEHLNNYKYQGFPIIFFDRPCNIEENTNVIIDDFEASFKATEYLIKTGCKNIIHFSGPQTLDLYRRRLNGFKEALKKHNLKPNPQFILESRLMQEDGIKNAKKILNLPLVDGVFSANDTAAISAMQYLKTQGKSIPNDIAFIGFSNEPISAVMVPSLTTVQQPDFKMGYEATKLLLKDINDGNNDHSTITKVFSTNLILRESTKKIPEITGELGSNVITQNE